MQWLRSLVSRSPRASLLFGKAVFLAGCILILGAVFARSGLANVNAERAETRQPPLRTLAEAYPGAPTWIVPEGPLGFGVAALLVLAGMGLTVLAENVQRRRR